MLLYFRLQWQAYFPELSTDTGHWQMNHPGRNGINISKKLLIPKSLLW